MLHSSSDVHASRLDAVTAVLRAVADDELPQEELVARLVPIIYDELREIARAQRHRIDVSGLQTTALVHEAYLKMAGRSLLPNRSYVFAAVAQAMRDVLVDHARRRGAKKRGSGEAALTLSAISNVASSDDVDSLAGRVLDVDAAIRRLEDVSPRAAKLVELRFFGGLSIDEAAATLEISRTTAKREWRRARAWLHRALEDGPVGTATAEGEGDPLQTHAH
ncbi:ECF-type sigma factor [Rubrivirga sp.]|uniref:ECF-type sigma factor n=1 Tax=Rubrivirga sp. TaxID=1885344 RepID=UPI003C7369C4